VKSQPNVIIVSLRKEYRAPPNLTTLNSSSIGNALEVDFTEQQIFEGARVNRVTSGHRAADWASPLYRR
jgi:hypothetical protein